MSNEIDGKRQVMKHLVGRVAYLLPSCLQRVNDEMGKKHHPKLPSPSENKIKRQTVKQTMDNKMIPVISLGLGKEIGLQNVVSDEMADNQNEYFFNHSCKGRMSVVKSDFRCVATTINQAVSP